MEKFTN